MGPFVGHVPSCDHVTLLNVKVKPTMRPVIRKKGATRAIERVFEVKERTRGRKVVGKDQPVFHEKRAASQSPSKKRGREISPESSASMTLEFEIPKGPTPKRLQKGKVCKSNTLCMTVWLTQIYLDSK